MSTTENRTEEMGTRFCTNCRKETSYTFKKEKIEIKIRGKIEPFIVTTAICDECGANMCFSGMIDKNIAEVDTQYRKRYNLITIEEIKEIITECKNQNSSLLSDYDFSDKTMDYYLKGMVPTELISDMLKEIHKKLMSD